jgi:hypothetical protein
MVGCWTLDVDFYMGWMLKSLNVEPKSERRTYAQEDDVGVGNGKHSHFAAFSIGECLGSTEGGGRSPFFHAAHFSGETGGLLQGLLREALSNYDLLPGGLYPGLNG